jgi:hypothetical protein
MLNCLNKIKYQSVAISLKKSKTKNLKKAPRSNKSCTKKFKKKLFKKFVKIALWTSEQYMEEEF